jgi:cob(I)alamin adenosyltransferase
LALRAAGAGFRVFIAQFIKGSKYSELEAIKRFSDRITLKQYGKGFFIKREPSEKDVRSARSGLEEVKKIVTSGHYQLVILDEANVAIHRNLFSIDDLLEIMHVRPENMELVITGRYAHPSIIEAADLVTDMQEVKHYYAQGVPARVGIDK